MVLASDRVSRLKKVMVPKNWLQDSGEKARDGANKKGASKTSAAITGRQTQ